MKELNAVERIAKMNADNFEIISQVRTKDILATAKAFRALERERNALAAKGLELCREAAHIYRKYNATQMPDMDLVDCQTIQELSDLAAKIGTGRSS